MGVLQAGTNRGDLYEIYLDLAKEFRVPVRLSVLQQTEKKLLQARVRAQSRGVLFNERLVYPWPRRTRDVFFEEIPKLPPGVSEISLPSSARRGGTAWLRYHERGHTYA